MTDSITSKNELIFQYAAGTSSLAKSLMASTYLFLNSKESSVYSLFENYCGMELKNVQHINPKKFTAEDCIAKQQDSGSTTDKAISNPINNSTTRPVDFFL